MASLLENWGWHEWLCHSNFSFLLGASHPDDLVMRATEYHYSSLSMTDFDGVYGLARSWRALQKQKKRQQALDDVGNRKGPLALHYGAEIHLKNDHRRPVCDQDTLVLLALTIKGYHNLCVILSAVHDQGKNNAFIALEKLLSYPVDDLVAIQPMRGLIRGTPELLRQRSQAVREHFLGRLYFVVSRHLHRAEDQWIAPTLQVAKACDCKILLSQDIFFHSPEQKKVNDLLHAIRHNKSLDAVPEQLFVNANRCPQPIAALEKCYRIIPQFAAALEWGHELYLSFSFDLKELRYHYPKEMIPAGYNAQDYLEKITWECAKKVYGLLLPQKITDLLVHELERVQTLGFADYFLTVQDIVCWARQQGILCQGRGSAANSAICFVLGITAVNPEHFEVLFERFMSVERGDPPDIDVDFEHERREEVIQYIYRRYGRDCAAMVCNVITFKSKGAMRFSGRALGVDETIISKAADLLKSRRYRGGDLSAVTGVLAKQHPDVLSAHTWALWAEMSARIYGFPRHLGIHSGGFMLADKPIQTLCAIEPATMPGRSVIQWSKEDIEALGFFKIDILALGMLTAIRKCFQLLKQHHGLDLCLATIPADDGPTYHMIQKAETVGVFQIESRAQMSFLPRHLPRHFYDLVIQVAIIRPGPIQGGMIHPYLRRREGLEEIDVPDVRLEPILRRTFGVPIFQEQVMRIAMAVGNFSAGEADQLRKSIGAFSMTADVSLCLEKLARGMRQNGIPETFAERILNQIKGFSSYGFPESHAASFALLAYASSYLKCHYPAAYATALLNSQPMGFYSADTILKDVRLAGVKLLAIDILHSNWDHQWISGAIRLGFRLVKGLKRSVIDAIVGQRHGGWKTLEDLLRDVSMTRIELSILAAANALASLGFDRRSAIWLAEAAPFCDLLESDGERPFFQAENDLEAVQHDYQATSTSLGRHPSALMKEHAWAFAFPVNQLTLSNQLRTENRDRRISVFGLVTCRQSPPTAKSILFITLWDEYGSIDVVIKPRVYQRYADCIDRQRFLCVTGLLQVNKEARSVLAHKIWPLLL